MGMNKVPRHGYRALAAEGNGHAGVGDSRNGSAVRQQAQDLVSLLLGLTRELLVVDDVTAELPLRQLRVCALLHEGARSMSVLSRELGVSLSATTQIADRLIRARLVKRVFEGTDRRVRSLQLTKRGQRIMRLRESARVERMLGVVEQLPPKARREVLAAFSLLLKATTATKR